MTALTHVLELEDANEAESTLAGHIRARIRGLLDSMHPATAERERRRDERFAFPRIVYLMASADGEADSRGEVLAVVGKDLSELGLGFFHSEPILARRAIVSLPDPAHGWLSLLMELRWCRFIRHGWYESGGRFLRGLPQPLGPPQLTSELPPDSRTLEDARWTMPLGSDRRLLGRGRGH